MEKTMEVTAYQINFIIQVLAKKRDYVYKHQSDEVVTLAV